MWVSKGVHLTNAQLEPALELGPWWKCPHAVHLRGSVGCVCLCRCMPTLVLLLCV